jgi:hypothetical protein
VIPAMVAAPAFQKKPGAAVAQLDERLAMMDVLIGIIVIVVAFGPFLRAGVDTQPGGNVLRPFSDLYSQRSA